MPPFSFPWACCLALFFVWCTFFFSYSFITFLCYLQLFSSSIYRRESKQNTCQLSSSPTLFAGLLDIWVSQIQCLTTPGVMEVCAGECSQWHDGWCLHKPLFEDSLFPASRRIFCYSVSRPVMVLFLCMALQSCQSLDNTPSLLAVQTLFKLSLCLN